MTVVRSVALWGRGQPLSFALSFGEIPWFDVQGEIQEYGAVIGFQKPIAWKFTLGT